MNPNTIKTSMGLKEWLMLIVLSVLWGGSFFFVGVAVNEVPPLTIVTLRVLIAALTLWGVVLCLRIPIPREKEVWMAFLIMGLLNIAIPFSLIVWGQSYISSGLASILNATTPLFAVIVAGLLLPDEKATPLKGAGVVIGFSGVVIMFGLPAEGDNILAQGAILLATFTYALAGVYGRRFKKLAVTPMVTAAGQVTGSTILLIPVTIVVDGIGAVQNVSANSWYSILSLAFLSTALAYILYFKILEKAGATNLLLVTLLVPISAILLGVLFLSETMATKHFIGMGLISFGLLAIDGRLLRGIKMKRAG